MLTPPCDTVSDLVDDDCAGLLWHRAGVSKAVPRWLLSVRTAVAWSFWSFLSTRTTMPHSTPLLHVHAATLCSLLHFPSSHKLVAQASHGHLCLASCHSLDWPLAWYVARVVHHSPPPVVPPSLPVVRGEQVESSVYGYAGLTGHFAVTFTQAGESASGLLVTIIQMATKAAFPSSKTGVLHATYTYFGLSMLVCLYALHSHSHYLSPAHISHHASAIMCAPCLAALAWLRFVPSPGYATRTVLETLRLHGTRHTRRCEKTSGCACKAPAAAAT